MIDTMSKTSKNAPLRSRGLLAGDVAKRLGIGVQTLHYYEREKLIPAPQRSGSGYRIYTPEIVERVAFIRKAQALGLPLGEVREVLLLVDEGACPCGHVQRALTEKLRDVDERLREMRSYRAELAALVERAPKLRERAEPAQMCPIVEESALPAGADISPAPLRRLGRQH